MSHARPVYFSDWSDHSDDMDDLMAAADLDNLMVSVECQESSVPLSCTASGLPLAPVDEVEDRGFDDLDPDGTTVHRMMDEFDALARENVGNNDRTARENTRQFLRDLTADELDLLMMDSR